MIGVAEKNLTIKEILSWAEEYLQTHGVPDCKTEAEYLLTYLLNCKKSWLYLNCNQTVDSYDLRRFTDFIERRIKREPSQYIIGEQEFWGLAFKVNRDVLIPRPETEILVEETVKTVSSKQVAVSSKNKKGLLRTAHCSPLTILDLCTGSGCIAVSLAKEIPDSRIYAVDMSEKALSVARENAEKHGVADRITFLQGDLFESTHSCLPSFKRESSSPPLWKRGVRGDFQGKLKFDLIVSNPPYISKKMMAGLEPEVKDYEPVAALYGGEDGLDFYRRIISEVPKYLAKDGCILLEIGYGQAEEIKKLIEQHKAFEHIDIKKDFAGIDRVIKAQRKG